MRVCFFILALSLNTILAATDRWTNSLSGLWRVGSTNWSLGIPPVSVDTALITNNTTKTVTVDAATDSTNLTVSSLTLSAPSGSTNTLKLVDLTTNSQLRVTSALTVNSRAVLLITNSGLRVDSTFDVAGGTLTQDNGLINAVNATLRVGRLAGGTGVCNFNGGNVNLFKLQAGAFNNSTGVVNLAGGVLNASSIVSMGEALGSTGNMFVTSGELIATNDLTKVGNLGPGQFTQSGGTTRFAFLSVGDNMPGRFDLSGGTLIMQPRNDTDFFRVGNLGNGDFNQSGGVALVMSEFHLADDITATGTANLTGGQFFATNQIVAIGRYGTGVMTISNATAIVTNVSVGRHDGATGTLNVLSNGVLNCLDILSIGRFSNSVGHMLINGGSVTLTNDKLWIGREGTGDLTISNGTLQAQYIYVGVAESVNNHPYGSFLVAGGNTIATSALVVGSELLSTGQVVVASGSLTIPGTTNAGLLAVANGSFTLNQGSVTVQSLLLTNSSGTFLFNGGNLQAASITVSNGAAFVVGDGVNPATLQLQGGSFTFADGLVISSNATVTGCGKIIGTITNYGTLATNCAGSGVIITAIVRTNTLARVYFSTTNGGSYYLQSNTNLTTTNWANIPPAIVGNGSVMSQIDGNATNAARFYRVRVQ